MIDPTEIPQKPFKTYNELINLLKTRNVYIEDEDYAKRYLSEYSYYGLINGYKSLYVVDENDKFVNPIPFKEFVIFTPL